MTTIAAQKNILAIHDISCVGRCSTTVALPIISALGVECRILPTAILSTHTGGFSGFTCLDLTDEMKKIIKAWEHLDLKFDGIYSGYMASAEQIDILKNVIELYREGDTVAIVDPVMADGGKLYGAFDEAFVVKMREIVPYADVLIPNITEACFLANVEYQDGPYTEEYIENLISALKKQGAKNVVLTGVFFDEKTLGVAASGKCNCGGKCGSEHGKGCKCGGESGGGCKCGKVEYYMTEKVLKPYTKKGDSFDEYFSVEELSGYFHGTGDIFGSVFASKYLESKSLLDAAKSAADFVVASIKATPAEADKKYGVDFESVLKEGVTR